MIYFLSYFVYSLMYSYTFRILSLVFRTHTFFLKYLKAQETKITFVTSELGMPNKDA
jgi:hypothetical protein